MHTYEADSKDSLFRLFDYQGGLKTILNRKLRFKTADQFNDPYELKPSSFIPDLNIASLSSTEFLKEIHKVKGEPLRTIIRVLSQSLSPEELEKELRPQVEDSIKTYIKNARDLFDYYRRSSYINCLTENIHDVKMWANYANKGSGLAIEFNVSQKRDNFFRCARPVTYFNNIPSHYRSLSDLYDKSAHSSKKENWEALFHYFSHSKINNWEEEREWRIILSGVSKMPFFDQQIDLEDIKAVYLGYNIKDEGEIIQAIRNSSHEIRVMKAVLLESEYGIRFVDV